MIASHTLDSATPRDALTLPRHSTWEAQAVSFILSDLLAFASATLASVAIVDVAYSTISHTVIDPTLANMMGAGRHGWGVILILMVTLAQFRGKGHYIQRIPFWTVARDVVSVTLLAFLCDLIISTKIYAVRFELAQAIRWVLFIVLILVFRSVTTTLLSRAGAWTLSTLVIGPACEAARVSNALRSDPGLGYSLVGTFTGPSPSGCSKTRQWSDVVSKYGADYVALVANPNDPAGDAVIVSALNRARIPFAFVHAVSALPVRMARSHYFMTHDVVMMSGQNGPASPFRLAAKRGFDIVASALILTALSALVLAIAVMVRRGGGPVLYRHQRVGLGGKSFGCLKFRSMDVDGDSILADLLARDGNAAAEWATTQKLRDDPRVTPIGRFLRNTSLDELPQLINVLRGEMSLVGPRPVVQSEIAFYGDDADYYRQARPGVTGLWQVSGRSDTTYEERVYLDAWYVRNWTLWHDLAILMKTIPVVFFRRGAV